MAEITVYGADWCPDCTRTKRALDAAGADYVYRDLVAEPQAAQEAEALSGRKNIPVVVLPDGVILVEPSDPELLDAVARAGSD
ncbi:MAG: glutaredoxin family protein [Actinobacteria bacterium]|nr:glutaredoxin family protein [Actinomycetota bacterium]